MQLRTPPVQAVVVVGKALEFKMKVFMLGAFMLLSACVTTPQVEEAQCRPRMTLAYWGEEWGVESWNPLSPKQRLSFLGWFNSMPPMSEFNPKVVYLVKSKASVNGPGWAVAVFHDGKCIITINPIGTMNKSPKSII